MSGGLTHPVEGDLGVAAISVTVQAKPVDVMEVPHSPRQPGLERWLHGAAPSSDPRGMPI